ncbi:MAG: hypothetical protein E6H08_15200 [Bacteroidetes bacterium]|jgi:hypothetical protein|nr:MAG: hypothetical protein E6H08_15200 [Bacteroidota bacterium]
MNKHKTIVALLDKISLSVNLDLVEIVDYWQADLCAIGIRKKNKLVYVSNYNYLNEKQIKFDYDLELIEETGSNKGIVIKEGRNVTDDELITDLKKFLAI